MGFAATLLAMYSLARRQGVSLPLIVIVVVSAPMAFALLPAVVFCLLLPFRPFFDLPDMAYVNVGDQYAESGDAAGLLEKYGLTPKAVADAARRLSRA